MVLPPSGSKKILLQLVLDSFQSITETSASQAKLNLKQIRVGLALFIYTLWDLTKPKSTHIDFPHFGCARHLMQHVFLHLQIKTWLKWKPKWCISVLAVGNTGTALYITCQFGGHWVLWHGDRALPDLSSLLRHLSCSRRRSRHCRHVLHLHVGLRAPWQRLGVLEKAGPGLGRVGRGCHWRSWCRWRSRLLRQWLGTSRGHC